MYVKRDIMSYINKTFEMVLVVPYFFCNPYFSCAVKFYYKNNPSFKPLHGSSCRFNIQKPFFIFKVQISLFRFSFYGNLNDLLISSDFLNISWVNITNWLCKSCLIDSANLVWLTLQILSNWLCKSCLATLLSTES